MSGTGQRPGFGGDGQHLEGRGASPLVLSTASAAERLAGSTVALPVWQHRDLSRPDVRELRVTAVPAQHGPGGTVHVTGEVTGFVVTGQDVPTVYVSGDNASLAVVRAVAERCGPIDIAVLFAGRPAPP